MSLYKRGKAWYVNITISGVRIHRKAGKTKAAAAEYEALLRAKDRELSITGETSGIQYPFEKIASSYLDHIKETRSARLHELESSDLKKHLLPLFRDFLIGEINIESLQRYQALKKREGYANRTINIHVGLIRKIRRFAVDRGQLPLDKLRYPMLPEQKKQHAFLTPKEKEDVMKIIRAPRKNLSSSAGRQGALALTRIRFGILTGLRPKELAFLMWTDIDEELKTLKVQSHLKEGFAVKDREERTIPLGESAIKILKSVPRRSPYVFSDTARPILSIRRSLRTLMEDLGIKRNITPNMLRHTMITHLIMHGADLKSVQTLAGHSDIKTTMRYCHAVDEKLRDTVKLLDILPQRRHTHKKVSAKKKPLTPKS